MRKTQFYYYISPIFHKLGEKVKQGIFVGYSSVLKVYRIYRPQIRKVITSSNFHFSEDEEWNWIDDERKKKMKK